VTERLKFGLVKPLENWTFLMGLKEDSCTGGSPPRNAAIVQDGPIAGWHYHPTMHWARVMAGMVVSAGRVPFELVDRFVAYCIDCECKQEQSTDLWPEYDLPTREEPGESVVRPSPRDEGCPWNGWGARIAVDQDPLD
jgi:hypothetical protein